MSVERPGSGATAEVRAERGGDADTRCPGCGRQTRTIGGICPNCGRRKSGAPPSPRRVLGDRFYDDPLLLSITWLLLPVIALAVVGVVIGLEVLYIAAMLIVLVAMAVKLVDR